MKPERRQVNLRAVPVFRARRASAGSPPDRRRSSQIPTDRAAPIQLIDQGPHAVGAHEHGERKQPARRFGTADREQPAQRFGTADREQPAQRFGTADREQPAQRFGTADREQPAQRFGIANRDRIRARVVVAAAVMLATGVLGGCSLFKKAPVVPPPPPPPPPPVAYVDARGDDRDPGTAEAPVRTLAQALKVGEPTIEIRPSTHDIGRIFITRPVSIVATATGTVLRGAIFVSSPGVRIEGVEIIGGLEAAQSDDLTVRDVVVRADGAREEAVALVHSAGRFERVRIDCASEACLQVTTSTVTMSDLTLVAAANTKRGFRASSARALLENLSVRGTRIAQLQADLGASVEIRRGQFRDAEGSAIVAVLGSTVTLTEVETASVAKTALFAQSSTVTATDCRLSAVEQSALSVSGARVHLADSQVTAGAASAVEVKAFEGRDGELRIERSTVRHSDGPGVVANDSRLIATATEFIGRNGPRGGDAILLRGPRTQAQLTDVRIIEPAGHGVAVVNDAAATINGTITGAVKGGVYIQEVYGHAVELRGADIRDCQGGAAVEVVSATNVRIDDSRLQGCPKAGIVASRRAVVHIARSEIQDSGKYGAAAFGGAQLIVESSTVAGQPWSIFHACSDESMVIDAGNNRFEGRNGRCI